LSAVITRIVRCRLALIAIALAIALPRLIAQTLDVRVVGDMLHLRGAGIGLIEGPVAEHLKDGRSVRVDFEMTILEKPRGVAITQSRHSFILSFDLWEQRFAVTRTGAPPRSISHLMARDAEAWCLDNMSVSTTSLGRAGRDTPFWIRVRYQVQDQRPTSNPDDDSTFGLRTLIDVLSRRKPDEPLGRSLEGGPFRLGN
jgi:hypothetical protein